MPKNYTKKNIQAINGIIGVRNSFMKKNIVYKVPNGKMLRIRYDSNDDTIVNIKIFGDFFIHPEESILDIEQFLIGKKINQVAKNLTKFVDKKNITLIGFTPIDIENALI